MKEKKEKYVRMAKNFFDENNMDLIDIKLDVWMHRWMKLGLLEWLLNFSFIQNILHSSFVIETNAKIKSSLPIIFVVLWWIFVASGIVWVFSFLVQLTSVPFVFSFGFFVGIRVLLYILISFARSLLSILLGIGSIRRKVWLPFLTVVWCGLSLLALVVTLIPSGFYESVSYGTAGSSLMNLFFSFVLFVTVIKNKNIFSA